MTTHVRTTICRTWYVRAVVVIVLTLASVVSVSPKAYADAVLCSGNSFSACTGAGYTAHGYESSYTNPYWNAYPGHNCTNYVGYMLARNGDSGHGVAMGNASQWDDTIANHPEWGYAINGTPAVGAIAQWNGFTSPWVNTFAGHVAYVESVSSNSITVSEDNYPSGPFRWRVISVGSAEWPSNFLHIKDVNTGGSSPTPTSPNAHIRTVVGQFKLDFDNDGREDVAHFRRTPSNLLRLYVTWGADGRDPRATTNVWEVNYSTSLDVTPVGVDDVDGDGYDDVLVFLRTTSNLLRLYAIWGSNHRNMHTHTNLWETSYETSRKVTPAGIVDFDGDGIKDITFFLKRGNNDLLRLHSVWGAHHRNMHTHTNMWEMGLPSGRKAFSAGTADFDNDGRKDISVFVALGNNDLLRLYTVWGAQGRNTRPATNMWEGSYSPSLDISPAGVTDFDNDGREDILVFRRTTSNLLRLYAVWGGDSRNTRTASNLWEKSYPVGRQAVPAGITDFDGDGLSDVSVLTVYGNNDLLRLYTIWGAQGRGARTGTMIREGGYDGNRSLAALSPSDLDTDQKSDISYFVMVGNNDQPRLITIWGDTNRNTRPLTITWEGNGTHFPMPAM